MAALAVVRTPVSAEELEQFETDALAGFLLARASAGLTPKRSRNRSRGLPLIRALRIGYTSCLAPEPTAQYC